MAKSSASRLDKSLPRVKEWATEIAPPDLEWINTYLNGNGKIYLATENLFSEGMREVKRSLLAAQAGQSFQANQHMAFGFARMLWSQMTDIGYMKGSDQTIIGTLDGVVHLMFGAIATGQPELVKPFYKVVMDGINGGYGVSDGHDLPLSSTLRYAAFGLSIISNWLGEALDLDKHALPRDPAWGLLVAHWREPDPDALLPVLLSACDIHVDRISLTERKYDTGKFEFGSVFLAVHPTEILAVLRLRDLLNLSNPVIEHPLMQTPYASITSRPGELTGQDDLLRRYLDAVRLYDPKVLPPGM